MSPFLSAIEKNLSIDQLKTLVNCGCNIDEKDSKGRTALMLACYNLNIVYVEFLIYYGANVNSKDSHLYTPLMFVYDSTSENDLKYPIVKLLFSKGASLNECNHKGNSIFMKACACKCILEHLKWMIDNGANFRFLNNEGLSAIEICMLKDMRDVYEYLSYLI